MAGAAGSAPPTVPVPLDELLQLASGFEAAGRYDEAQSLVALVLGAFPRQPGALHLAGVLAFRRGEREEAVRLIEQSVALGFDEGPAHRNLASIYRGVVRLDEALAAARRAAALAPTDPLCLQELAAVHAKRLEWADALAWSAEALAYDPALAPAHFTRAEALLSTGAFAEGWEEYEWRFKLPAAAGMLPATDRPQWDGQPFDDDLLLLVADQGAGDVIQFARYLPWVAERCPRFVVAAPKAMTAILGRFVPQDRLYHSFDACPPYRAFCPLSGLPRLHGTRLDTIPPPLPGFEPAPGLLAQWQVRLDRLVPRGYRRLGIVWAGSEGHGNDFNRSASLKAFAPLGDLPGVALLAIQIGPRVSQAGQYFGRAPLINLGGEIHDFEDTIALLRSIDLLVTVDTSCGHLAGSLGVPTFVLLPHCPDWRWLLDRSDSPWYPSVRLFRQPGAGDWKTVVAEARAAVARTLGLA
jgi:hypothetical protein